MRLWGADEVLGAGCRGWAEVLVTGAGGGQLPPGSCPFPAQQHVTFPAGSFGFCPSWESFPICSVSQLFLLPC